MILIQNLRLPIKLELLCFLLRMESEVKREGNI
jgi:hypothetical protein